MAHTAITVAAALLNKANEKGLVLTPMQLLKLVYIAHGWMLGLCSRPLIHEDVEAWQYGPVIPEVYHAVKHFRDSPVTSVAFAGPAPLDAEESDLIDQVLDIYGKKNGIALSSITHKPGTPWDKTWNSYGKNAKISNDLIESHYSDLYEKAHKKAESPA